MPSFQDVLKSQQASKLMKDSKQLERLRDAPETQRLFQLLSQNAGGDLERAAGQAANGNAAPLMDAIQRLMQDPEGQTLLQQMKRSIR
jgi:hypothetical protein